MGQSRMSGPVVVEVDGWSRTIQTATGSVVRFDTQALPFTLLEALIEAAGRPLEARVLYERVWGERYLGRPHDRRLHSTVHRLRRLLDRAEVPRGWLVATPRGYALDRNPAHAWLPAPQGPEGGRERPGAERVERALRTRGWITCSDYCRLGGVSRATALRRLKRLVTEGRLVAFGAGRGRLYRRPRG